MISFSTKALAFTALTLLGTMTAVSAAECQANKAYSVAWQEYDGEAGAQFAVTTLADRKAPKKCAFDARKASFVIGTPGDPLWFGELAGNLLILTRSTGPQGDLVVYDLAGQTKILDVASDDYALSGGKLVFWERGAEATEVNCPDFAENQANGMGSVISAEKRFDAKSGALTATGKQRCDATQ